MQMTIKLSAMRFFAFHGVMPQEQVVGADYQADLELLVDVNATAYRNDLLDGTVNYAEVHAVVKREMQQSSQLLEHVVYRVTVTILRTFPSVLRVKITLAKLNPPIIATLSAASVALELNRSEL